MRLDYRDVLLRVASEFRIVVGWDRRGFGRNVAGLAGRGEVSWDLLGWIGLGQGRRAGGWGMGVSGSDGCVLIWGCRL